MPSTAKMLSYRPAAVKKINHTESEFSFINYSVP